MDLYFKDSMHRKFFEDFMKFINLEEIEKELISALYLVCGSSEYELIGRYIDIGRKTIHLDSFLDSEDFFTMDYPDQEITRLAAALYKGSQCDVSDCFGQLKGPDLKIALTAVEMRYGSENLITG